MDNKWAKNSYLFFGVLHIFWSDVQTFLYFVEYHKNFLLSVMHFYKAQWSFCHAFDSFQKFNFVKIVKSPQISKNWHKKSQKKFAQKIFFYKFLVRFFACGMSQKASKGPNVQANCEKFIKASSFLSSLAFRKALKDFTKAFAD